MKFLSQINVNTEYTLPIVDGTNGQVLATDGNGTAYWGSISAGATNLDALTDVILTSPSSGQLLRYGIPPGSGEAQPVWYNFTPNYLTPSSSIDNLGDVTITSAAAGQVLQWNGTAWVNATPSTAEYTSKVQHLVKCGVAVTKGQAVYVTSADGTNMIVGLASNASEATSSKVIGLAVSTGAINDQIFVVTEGLIAGLNTSTANAGDPVWLGTGGNLIFGLLNKPVAPAHLVYLGVVTRVQQNNGEIFVNVQNGFELHELHDVLISSPSAGQLLRRDSDGLWKNWTPNYLTSLPVHNHDDRYYTESEIAGFFGGEAPIAGYNATNWDTAYGWGDHAAEGYLTSFTESDTLSSVTGRGNTTTTRIGVLTSTAINLATAGNLGTWIGGIQDGTTGWSISNNGIGLKADNTTYSGIVMGTGNGPIYFGRTLAGGTGTMASWLEVNSSGTANFKLSRPQHNGSNLALVTEIPTNLNQLTNGPGYITGYTETDTLATVTGRGNSTTTALYFTGGSGEIPALHIRSGGSSWSEGLAIHPSTNSGYALSFYRTRAAYTDQTNTWAIGNLGDSNALNHFGLLRKGLTGGIADRSGDAIFTINPTGTFKFGFNPYVGGNVIWHAGNDGDGSGLDADSVDGVHASNIVWGNARGTNDSVTTDADGLDKTGFYTSSGFVTRPDGVANWMYIQHIKLYNDNSQYQKQIGYDTYDDSMWVRTKNANTWSSWKAIITSDNIGSQSVAYAGEAGSVVNQGGQLLRFDNRTISPSETSAGYLQFGFTSWTNNNAAPYADYLHMRSYTDSSGGSDNLVMFKKSGIGMRIWQQSWGSSTAYSSYADVWTTENFSQTNVNNWNTAYGWGNHADAGYLTEYSYTETDTLATVTSRGGSTGSAVVMYGKVTLGNNTSGTYNGNTNGLTLNSTAEIRSTGVQNPPALTWHYEGLATRHLLMTSAGAMNFVSPSNEASGVAVLQVNGNTVWHAGNLNPSGFVATSGAEFTGPVIVNVGDVAVDTMAFKVAGPSDYDSLTIGMRGTPDYDSYIASFGNDIHFYSGKGVTSENHSFFWYTSKAGSGQHAVVAMTLDHLQNLTIGGTYTENSSIRYKDNITPLESVSSKVEKLEAVTYTKKGDELVQLGLIAESVSELFPEIVKYDEEGRPDGVSYTRLSVILLKAVQELTERVNKLENK
jgi:hypothetical protein